MSHLDDSITVEDVEKALNEIDNKFGNLTKPVSKKDSYCETIYMLSNEFDSLGLPPIIIDNNSEKEVLEQVVTAAHCLVQIHRKTLQKLQNVDISNQTKDTKNIELWNTIESYKMDLVRTNKKCSNLQNTILKLNGKISDLEKQAIEYKDEISKLKKYLNSKQNEAAHNLNKVMKENDRLKQIFRKELGHYVSKDDITVELLNKYKKNEEIYKETIQKLQQNNAALVNEVLNLKDDLYHTQTRNDQ